MTLDKSTAAATIARVKAQAAAVARRATDIHPAARHLVPATYSDGAPGWTVPCGIDIEPDGSRLVIVAEDSFAAGKADFASADTKLPSDWKMLSDDGAVKADGGAQR